MVTMASGLVLECLQDLMFNYFMVTLGFGAADNAKILTLVGVSGLIVQVLPSPGSLCRPVLTHQHSRMGRPLLLSQS